MRPSVSLPPPEEEDRRSGVWAEYHAASRYFAGVANVTADQELVSALESQGIEYRFSETVPLQPDARAGSVATLSDVLRLRRSTRVFAARPAPKSVIDGVVSRAFIATSPPFGTGSRRPTPSAGRLYPIELYLVSLLSDELPPGTVAHLAAHPKRATQNWAVLPLTVPASALDEALLHLLPVGTAGVFVLSATTGKSTAKYGERGYRYCLIEVGHVAQNLLLSLQAAGLASVCVGGFADSLLNRLLELDGFGETALYVVCFGYPASETKPEQVAADPSDVR